VQHLVVFRVKPEATEEKQAPLRKAEAAKVWQLMTAGVLRSIHFIPGPGAVLQLEAKDEVDARAYINQLPMVQAGVVTVEVLPLRPFTGLEALFG
jgi:hypothetical protein